MSQNLGVAFTLEKMLVHCIGDASNKNFYVKYFSVLPSFLSRSMFLFIWYDCNETP